MTRFADIEKVVPRRCYENPAWRGASIFARDALLYAASLLLLARTSAPLWTLVGWIVAANAISALFVIAHDAAHGSLFRSRRANQVIGQLAMLPGLHALSVWAYGHNRIHHAFSCCLGFDFVWHPVSPEEFRAASPLARLRHRIEWSAIGSGLYYARAIWMAKIVQGAAPAKLRRDFARDRAIVALYALAFAVLCAFVGWQRHASVGGVVWALVELFLVPWILWNTMIGWAVYVHHIDPRIAWSSRRHGNEWRDQGDAATSYEMPRWVNLIWHNIFDHATHHLDPRIPFYHLPAATAALARGGGTAIERRPYRLRDYVETTRRCKLFDLQRGAWVDYRGRPARVG